MPSSSGPPSGRRPGSPGPSPGSPPGPDAPHPSVSWAEALLSFAQRYPGVHLREVIRQLKIPTGTLDYHLYRLSQRGLLETRTVEGRRCVYPSRPTGQGPPIPETDKLILALLRQRVPRALLLHLVYFGPSTAQELADSVGVPSSLLAYYLDRLEALRLLERRGTRPDPRRAFLRNPEQVRNVLLSYPPLKEGVSDRWLNLWEGVRA